MDLLSFSSPLCAPLIPRWFGEGPFRSLAALAVLLLEFIGPSFALARSQNSALSVEGGRLGPSFPALAGTWLLLIYIWILA